MCFVVERYCGCRASSLFFRSKPKYSTIPVSRSGDTVNRRPVVTLGVAHDVNRFRIAALSLDDYAAGLAYMAGLAHDAGQSAYDLFKDYPQSPA